MQEGLELLGNARWEVSFSASWPHAVDHWGFLNHPSHPAQAASSVPVSYTNKEVRG